MRSGGQRWIPRALVVSGMLPLVGWLFTALLSSTPVWAQTPPPGLPSISATCVETLPNGASRPDIVETFPEQGFSGYAAPLVLTIKHGKGETVLPNGFRVETTSPAFRALDRAGFAIPAMDGGSGPTLESKDEGDGVVTKLTIPVLLLPPRPGRSSMTLPALPISVARASNDVMTLCTAPHTIAVDEPIANESDPKVKPNPTPRHQREEWVFLEHLLLGILAGLLLGVLVGWMVVRHLRKPKPVPVVVRRKPWVVALEELHELRSSNLLAEGQRAEFYDRVSDSVRKYLGTRYGFEKLGIDGLETTSDEMRGLLKRVRPPIRNIEAISEFLADCDLVKFARVTPAEVDCLAAVVKGEGIVRATMPAEMPRRPRKGGGSGPGAAAGEPAAAGTTISPVGAPAPASVTPPPPEARP